MEYRKIGQEVHEPNLGAGIEIVRLPSFRYPTGTGQGRLVVPLGWALRSLRRWRPDILHTQQFYGVGLEAVLASWLLRMPLIGTVHESPGQFIAYSPIRGSLVLRFILKYASWYYNRCRFVTAPSRFIFPEMVRYGLYRPHDRLSNPIDVARFHPDHSESHGPTVLYAGRLAPEKNVDVCLQAFMRVRAQVPDARFRIAGRGISEHALKALAQKMGLGSSVEFLGYLEPSALVSAYQAADVFMVASTAEMQCLAMMQAMACRLPVIAVNAGGLPEYVSQGGGFVVPTGDVAALAEKLQLLFTDAELRQRMGAHAFGYVQQFRPSMIAREWEALYERTIQSA
jgi:glycosyltransferase involved in cell wall biosynthesis